MPIVDTPPRLVLDIAMRSPYIAAIAALALAACADYPRDAEGTLDDVRSSGTIRLGLAPTAAADRPELRRFLGKLGQATGAQMQSIEGSEEELLAKLENGEIDLVAGRFAEDSPWVAHAALIEPLSSRPAGKRKIGLALAARSGENAWIGLLERTVRDVRVDQ